MRKTLNLHNDVNEVAMLCEWIEVTGEQLGLPTAAVFQLNLALEEAFVNVVDYAYPGKSGMPVQINMESTPEGMTFTLIDEGQPFDPTQLAPPDITLSVEERPIGGLGVFLVTQIMDEVIYERQGARNVLTMRYTVKDE